MATPAPVEAIITDIKAILTAENRYFTAGELNSNYRSINGEPIPFKSFGFPTLQAFLHQADGIATVFDGELKFFYGGTNDGCLDLLRRMVIRQQKNKKRRKKGGIKRSAPSVCVDRIRSHVVGIRNPAPGRLANYARSGRYVPSHLSYAIERPPHINMVAPGRPARRRIGKPITAEEFRAIQCSPANSIHPANSLATRHPDISSEKFRAASSFVVENRAEAVQSTASSSKTVGERNEKLNVSSRSVSQSSRPVINPVVPYDLIPTRSERLWGFNRRVFCHCCIVAIESISSILFYDADLGMDDVYRKLTLDMKKFYLAFPSACFRMKPEKMIAGRFCVIWNESCFRRAQIYKVCMNDDVIVACVDEPLRLTVKREDVYELDAKFTEVSFRLIPARLRAVRLSSNSKHEEVTRELLLATVESCPTSDAVNVLVVGYDEDVGKYVIDIVLGQGGSLHSESFSLLSLVAAEYGVWYGSEFEEEVTKCLEEFLKSCCC